MPIRLSSLARGGLLTATLLLSLIGTGCAGPDGPRRPGRGRPTPPPPALAGAARFFEDRLAVDLRVGAEMSPETEAVAAYAEKNHRAAPDAPSGSLRAGGGMGPGPGGGPPRGFSEDRPGRTARLQLADRAFPPVRIRLRLTNHSTARLDVAVTDFRSVLGNFVILPAKLSLEPGQSAECEPMTSHLDNALTAVEVTLAVRTEARTERQTLQLLAQPAPPPPPDAPSQPPPA